MALQIHSVYSRPIHFFAARLIYDSWFVQFLQPALPTIGPYSDPWSMFLRPDGHPTHESLSYCPHREPLQAKFVDLRTLKPSSRSNRSSNRTCWRPSKQRLISTTQIQFTSMYTIETRGEISRWNASSRTFPLIFDLISIECRSRCCVN